MWDGGLGGCMGNVVPVSSGQLAQGNQTGIYLGGVFPSQDEIFDMIDDRRAFIAAEAAKLPDNGLRWNFLEKYQIVPFSTFSEWHKDLRKNQEDYLIDVKLGHSNLSPQMVSLVKNIKRYNNDLDGWMTYVFDRTPTLKDHIAKESMKKTFPVKTREAHTLITAPSNWGKSELLKALIFHSLGDDTSAAVVLDPHGDLVNQIAQWPETLRNSRVIVLDSRLIPGFRFGLNPLDANGLDNHGRSELAIQLSRAIGEIADDLTTAMQTVSRNCIRFLLDVPGATLQDLATMLIQPPKKGETRPDHPRRLELMAQAEKHPQLSEFFRYDFHSESFRVTKDALRNRLNNLFSLPAFSAVVNGQATINLDAALSGKSIILVNLAPVGTEGRTALGRLLLAMVAGIGYRRESIPRDRRTPVHVFIDEASTMIGPDFLRILTELRKFGIHLTMAQQLGGRGFDAEGKRELMNSTACKFIGGNLPGERKAQLGPEGAHLVDCKRGQFWVKWGELPPQLLKVRTNLANRHLKEGNEGLKEEFSGRIQRLYYQPDDILPASISDVPSIPQTSPVDELPFYE